MKPKYLVGYKRDAAVCGLEDHIFHPIASIDEAREKAGCLRLDDEKVVIYKLVPVEEKKVKEYR